MLSIASHDSFGKSAESVQACEYHTEEEGRQMEVCVYVCVSERDRDREVELGWGLGGQGLLTVNK